MAQAKTANEENSYSSYYKDVADAAKEIFDEAVEAKGPDKDSIRDEAMEKIHEAVDGSAWIIYTAKAMAVLKHSQNDDAIFDQGDGLHNVQSMSDVYTQAAFWAMYQDVSEALDTLIEEYEEPEETEDEDEEEETEEG